MKATVDSWETTMPPNPQSGPPHQVHKRFSEWFGGQDADRARGREQKEVGQEMPRMLPRSWREGERYFSQGVNAQHLRADPGMRTDE